jgi:tripartite-type tricarboxylate transporter receptor subunit TctC
MASLMAEPAPMSPDAFAAFVRAENARYEKVVKAIGVKLD